MAAGALVAAATILRSISNSPVDLGWSWVGSGCHKDPISDQIPTSLVLYFKSIKSQQLCGARIKHAKEVGNFFVSQDLQGM